MRILILTNFYPPYARGGEEYSCKQAVEGLRSRGHDVFVLTSNYGAGNSPPEDDMVSRSLLLEMDFLPWRNSLLLLTRRQAREAHNLRRLQQLIQTFEPDIIFIWGMWNLPRSLARLAEKLCAGCVVYRFATYWPALPSQYTQYWLAPGRTAVTRAVRRLMRPVALALAPPERNEPPLQFRHIICVSEAVRTELLAKGIDASQARIIYTGLDAGLYNGNSGSTRAANGEGLRLLYSGRLASEKGVHTVVEALGLLNERQLPDGGVGLSIAGAGDPEYEMQLKALVTDLSLGEQVSFLGKVPFEEMPALYSRFDVLVMPSIWPEPFARAVLEGMASGLAVIATAQGGTAEIIEDDQNGLLFAAADATDLANKIQMLFQQPAKRRELAAAARQTVREAFGEERMLDQMENYLLEIPQNH